MPEPTDTDRRLARIRQRADIARAPLFKATPLQRQQAALDLAREHAGWLLTLVDELRARSR